MQLAFSIDLEPNADGSFEGVRRVTKWFDTHVGRGTIYVTNETAKELPDSVFALARAHEIGIHVHPREFGYEHDQLAELDKEAQRELIGRTRRSVAEAAGLRTGDLTSFRAGRHSASQVTLSLLAELGFEIDASVNVRYDRFIDEEIRTRVTPVRLATGLVELPTTYVTPRILTRVGVDSLPDRIVTATANTLRTDSLLATGTEKIRYVMQHGPEICSMYMHPYDASDYYPDLENTGSVFRERMESCFGFADEFVSASDVASQVPERSTT